MTDDRDLLKAAAAALLGERWQAPLARLLHRPGAAKPGVDHRLVERWATGERPIPRWALVALRRRLVDRFGELSDLLDRLPRE